MAFLDNDRLSQAKPRGQIPLFAVQDAFLTLMKMKSKRRLLWK
ncbi:hypothetical protein ACFQ3S_09605 [Mucilaginibacter terrae]